MTHKVLGVIPARYGSTRLPGKPLKDICGMPMIQHVYMNAGKAKLVDQVVVATDDERVVEAVRAFGGEAVMTSQDHPTGSDRVAEAADAFGDEYQYIVNIQGDEPLIQPEIIDEIVGALINDSSCVMSTGCAPIYGEYAQCTDAVKVVSDINGNALYFSRSLIPYPRNEKTAQPYEHIGIYAYTKSFLKKYITLPITPLSQAESLEQLRVLENGYAIKVVKTAFPYDALSVDTENDLNEVIRIYQKRHGCC